MTQVRRAETRIDLGRARLNEPDLFQRFQVPDRGQPLRDAGLSSRTELIVFQQGEQRRALLMRQMAYHHLAQGELAGEPYAVSF